MDTETANKIVNNNNCPKCGHRIELLACFQYGNPLAQCVNCKYVVNLKLIDPDRIHRNNFRNDLIYK